MDIVSVPINPTRICDAIARIGYEPHSALMDIIDNSVAAGAKHINVIIELIENRTINQRNSVLRYSIIDDGNGMDDPEIKNAFTLGSHANYAANSLSKYGMGLKSAGFSLGTRIQIVSKKDGKLSKKYYVDRKIIEEKQDYVVCVEKNSSTDQKKYNGFIKNSSGTVVEVTGCDAIYHASAKSTINKLKHRLGVTYYPFLSQKNDPLSITLSYPGVDCYSIQPIDMLFIKDALPAYDPSTYTGAAPCYAYNEKWHLPGTGSDVAPIKIEVVTFPQDKMSKPESPLSEEERAKVRSFNVSKDNKGFFVYRNGRLIRWGDDLGMVGKDDFGFRARIELTTEHDDLLHVDVSKQRLEMDDETHGNLVTLMRLPRKQAKDIFKFCNEQLINTSGEGIKFSQTVDTIPEEDPNEEVSPPDTKVKKDRTNKKEIESREILKKLEEEAPPKDDGCTVEPDDFMKVRYSDNLNGVSIWSTQRDAIQGTFVIINRRHPFYQTVISSFAESSPERLAIEAFIFCCAVAENAAYTNLTNVNEDDIKRVFDRFYGVIAYNISEWSNANQHRFRSEND